MAYGGDQDEDVLDILGWGGTKAPLVKKPAPAAANPNPFETADYRSVATERKKIQGGKLSARVLPPGMDAATFNLSASGSDLANLADEQTSRQLLYTVFATAQEIMLGTLKPHDKNNVTTHMDADYVLNLLEELD